MALIRPDAHVYIDEAYSLRDNTFVLAATIVPQAHHEALTEQWKALQRRILTVLDAEYPDVSSYFAARPGELPEIHAVDLCHSQKYYRKYPRGTQNNDSYWEKHWDWLEEAFSIQDRFRLPTIIVGGDADMHDPIQRNTPRMSEVFLNNWNPEVLQPALLPQMLGRMDELQRRPFTWALPQMILTLENELRRRNWRAEIVCDDDEGDNRGFRISTMFEYLQSKGHLEFVGKPIFKRSHLETLLQLPDIHAYAVRRLLAAQRSDHQPTPLDKRANWWATYFTQRQLDKAQPAYMNPEEQVRALGLAYEYIIRNSGGPQRWREQLLLEFMSSFTRVTGLLER